MNQVELDTLELGSRVSALLLLQEEINVQLDQDSAGNLVSHPGWIHGRWIVDHRRRADTVISSST